jgi:hypothetical protein
VSKDYTKSSGHVVQPSALLAERPVIRSELTRSLSNIFTGLAGGVLMIDGHFSGPLSGFNGEPWAVDHEVFPSIIQLRNWTGSVAKSGGKQIVAQG